MAKFQNKSKFILVEPRTAHFNEIENFDFLIVNSFETKLFFQNIRNHLLFIHQCINMIILIQKNQMTQS